MLPSLIMFSSSGKYTTSYWHFNCLPFFKFVSILLQICSLPEAKPFHKGSNQFSVPVSGLNLAGLSWGSPQLNDCFPHLGLSLTIEN